MPVAAVWAAQQVRLVATVRAGLTGVRTGVLLGAGEILLRATQTLLGVLQVRASVLLANTIYEPYLHI